MEKNIRISILCDIYGSLLTDKQKDVLDLYYNDNLSLSEIAEEINITRQAVRDSIVKAEKKLYSFEENLGLMEKMKKQKEIIADLNEIQTEVNSSIKIKIDNIIQKINDL